MNKYKIIVINNAYASLGDPTVRDMYGKIIDLKKRCFSTVYSNSYAPVDKWDMHGTHLTLCGLDNNPLVTMRTVTNKVCRIYGYPYNGLSLLSSANCELHKKVLMKYISDREEQGKTIGTVTGLSFDPLKIKTSEYRKIMLNIFVPLFIFNFLNQKWDGGVLIGANRSGLNDRYSKEVGFDFLRSDSEKLSPIRIPSCGNQEFDVMTIDKLNSSGIQIAQGFYDFWIDRTVVRDKFNFISEERSLEAYFKNSTSIVA